MCMCCFVCAVGDGTCAVMVLIDFYACGVACGGVTGGEEDEVSVWAAVEEVLQRQWALEMRALVQVRTDNGRTRALLRAALNGKYLDHLLRALLPSASYPSSLNAHAPSHTPHTHTPHTRTTAHAPRGADGGHDGAVGG